MAGVQGTTDVVNNLASDAPAVQIQVDREAATPAGTSESAIGQTVAGLLRGAPIGQADIAGRTTDVVLLLGQAPPTSKPCAPPPSPPGSPPWGRSPRSGRSSSPPA